MHVILFGILLGLGAAIPIGPVNLEIIRRNLRWGTLHGISLGLGACSADVVYLVLLCLGALSLLNHPDILRAIGLIGSCVLVWFGINAFRASATESHEKTKKHSHARYLLEGFIITMINPFTILFWLSVSSQISLMAIQQPNAIYYAGTGVVIGTVSWIITLNTILHVTRHKLSQRVIRLLNNTGGVILLGFAAMGFWHALGFHY